MTFQARQMRWESPPGTLVWELRWESDGTCLLRRELGWDNWSDIDRAEAMKMWRDTYSQTEGDLQEIQPKPTHCTASKAGVVCFLLWDHDGWHDSNPNQINMDKVGRVQWSSVIKERT